MLTNSPLSHTERARRLALGRMDTRPGVSPVEESPFILRRSFLMAGVQKLRIDGWDAEGNRKTILARVATASDFERCLIESGITPRYVVPLGPTVPLRGARVKQWVEV